MPASIDDDSYVHSIENVTAASDPIVSVGNDLYISSLIPSQTQKQSIPLFYHGKGYAIHKCLRKKHQPDDLDRSLSETDRLIVSHLSVPMTNLGQLFHPIQETKYQLDNDKNLGKERSFQCRVISWIRAAASNSSSFTSIEIHAVDSSYVSILLTWSLPTDVFDNSIAKKLQTGVMMRIYFGVVTNIDYLYEIIQVAQGDRTVAHIEPNQSVANLSPKRIQNTPIKADIIPTSNVAEEDMRLKSIRIGQTFYHWCDNTIITQRSQVTQAFINAAIILKDQSSIREAFNGSNIKIILQLTIKAQTNPAIVYKELCFDQMPSSWLDSLTDINNPSEKWITIEQLYGISYSNFQCPVFEERLQVPVEGMVFHIHQNEASQGILTEHESKFYRTIVNRK